MVTKQDVQEQLECMGIPIYTKMYVVTAEVVVEVDKALENNKEIQITPIYEIVAKRLNTTVSAIERCVRHTHARDKEAVKQFLNCSTKINLTNKNFVFLLLRKTKQEKEI